jgi:Uma2 family endonuclease
MSQISLLSIFVRIADGFCVPGQAISNDSTVYKGEAESYKKQRARTLYNSPEPIC